MLTIEARGEQHPKTFVLKTDDADGELARINEILASVDIQKDDPEAEWFNGHTADQFAEGVEIPQDFATDFIELLEGDWPQAYETFENERNDAYRQAEEALGAED